VSADGVDKHPGNEGSYDACMLAYGITTELLIGLGAVAVLSYIIGINVSRCAGMVNVNSIMGWPMLVGSLLIIAANAPGDTGRIAIPQLSRFIGPYFALGFIAVEYVLAFYLRNRRALRLLNGFLVVGILLGWGSHMSNFWGLLRLQGISRMRYAFCAGAAVSGLAMSIALLHMWIRRQTEWPRKADLTQG
jgi:hypothetical protein